VRQAIPVIGISSVALTLNFQPGAKLAPNDQELPQARQAT